MIKLVFLFLCLSPLVLEAQKEGYLQYSISANALDTSLEVRQKVGLMRNSSLKIYFAEKFARVEFKMAGNYNVTTILDKTKSKSLNLMDSPMGKFAKRSNTDELQTVPIKVDSTSQIDVFKNEKIYMYHWGNAEKVYLKYMKHKYPDLQFPEIELIDLCVYFKKEPIVIQGCFGYGLKEIVKYLYNHKLIDHCWEDDLNGLDAMYLLLQFCILVLVVL